MFITQQQHAQAREARLTYRTLAELPRAALLEIRLETGRKHQIRTQLSHRGYPILGDARYGSSRAFPEGIALHARQLIIEHPVRKSPLVLQAPVPDCWRQFGVKDTSDA
jgi:23S rRNA pseudouridine1911/1915/1917 synthase